MNEKILIQSQELLDYWRDIFSTEETQDISEYDIYRELTLNGYPDILREIVRTASDDEVRGAFEVVDEAINFYYMQKLWWRYADVVNGDSEIFGNDVVIGEESSIHELPLLPSTFVTLHQLGCNKISEIKDAIIDYDLGSEILGDLIAARRMWE